MAMITGNSGNDFLIGTSNPDRIDGGGRRDYISGGRGNDIIIGGLGNDLLDGGGGNDTFSFGAYHDADNVYNFSRTTGNMDVIVLGEGIDAYRVTQEWNGIRIATVDRDISVENDPVYGSIVLNGVSLAQWQSWKGQLGWFTLESNPNPMITFEPDYPLTA
jgi:RTX calcium-binding nonapeptide repeat (4 copies)